jgi:NDP-sugar pyrophosphorylase family protein
MLTIVIPMGGEGRVFAERGYSFPKPLIEIDGRPMIEFVIRNLTPNEPHEFVFICKDEHLKKFALGDVLRQIAPSCHIVPMAQPTAGALFSVLLAMDFLQPDNELLVANADQYVDRPIDEFLFCARGPATDGCLVTFPNTHPKWSYARIEGGQVVAVAEKRPISKSATAGLYYFRETRMFVAAAERMIGKNAALGGEFYVCPVFNELILAGQRVTAFPIGRAEMHSLGTPEDVELFRNGRVRELALV